jgi:hypothetical protein
VSEDPSKDRPTEDSLSLWQELPVETLQFSIEEIRSKAQKLQSSVRRRNARELIAFASVVAAFSYYGVHFNGTLFRCGCALIIVGGGYAMWSLVTRGGSSPLPRTGLETCVAFHKSELEKQRDLLRSVWRWYLGPMIPGFVLFLLGQALEQHTPWWAVSAVGLIAGAVFLGVGRLNHHAAEKAQRDIDALSEAAKTK